MEYPSCTTVALATIYVFLGAGRVMLMKLSANRDHKYDYLPVTVNVCAEAVKLVVCLLLMLKMELNGRSMFHQLFHFSWPECLKFFHWSVPGLFYFLDNLIGFYVMSYFEPAVAVLLTNFGIISTALLFRVILKRKFSRVQWASLLVLFLAIVSLSNQDHRTALHNHRSATTLESVGNSTVVSMDKRSAIPPDFCHRKPRNNVEPTITNSVESKYSFTVSLGHILVIVQCFLASMANVYNEKIFKEGQNYTESIFIQNTRLYTFGVIFNLLTLFIIPRFRNRILYCGLFAGYNLYATLLIFDTALVGLTISLILKYRDNMFHVLSAQVTMVAVLSLSMWLTGFQPSLDFFLQMPTVFLAIFIYNSSHSPDQSVTGGARQRTPSESLRASRGHGAQQKRGSVMGEEMVPLTDMSMEEEDITT
ncbi:UDP-sugar transporter protein SLC35A5-like [Diadema setosum]|uniref:UDP-sugar transporter protein SLC35A5-like n=1 Tax=Diadema setosum TaxID=31175 RepID=UPI003B3A86E5